MIQTIIILLLFLVAIGYLIRLVYLHFAGEKSCAKGCGACSVAGTSIAMDKIKKQLQREHNS